MRNGIFRFLIENDSAAEKLKEKEEWRWEKEKKRNKDEGKEISIVKL